MGFTASVPGKLILLGEHAAVYGRPALVAAVGLRLRASVSAAPRVGSGDPGVRFRLPDSGVATALSWAAILDHAERLRQAWERYAAEPGPDTFAALAAPESGLGAVHLLQVALAEAAIEASEAAREAGEAEPAAMAPIDLTITSQIPVGSGFGSSAAAAVAVVMAYLAFRGVAADPRRLHRVSLEVERRQHGSPSGVDNATVLYGGILEARRIDADGASGEVAFEGVRVRSPLLSGVRVLGTGTPAEGTGVVVAAVRRLRDREPARVETALDRLGELTGRLRAELVRPDERPGELIDVIRGAEACLEELGVVPAPVRALVRRVEAEGGAAKISGAGSLAGPGAGNLIVVHPEPDRIERWPFLAGLARYPVTLGAPGARLEPAEALAAGAGGGGR
jgi:mevalonate kinase